MEQRRSSYLRVVPTRDQTPVATLEIRSAGNMFEFDIKGDDLSRIRRLQREVALAAPALARARRTGRS